MTSKPDPIRPAHYRSGGMEAIDVIEAFELGFNLGNTVKYVLRHRSKGNALEDLRKARWYLEREIKNLERAQIVIEPTGPVTITGVAAESVQ